ncbi:ArsR family transcriptional regulator [Natrinema salsiterrestre]|uniref:ArsR family transcriptional regulator n=1 Tax=Natrinema salsiterrestre TaxID=2950540 RepID=A0A9Q4Q1Y1_9EURY|nr:ArsR family transcriptional regulator [Natrinema salsiterrestre]MDF9744753.1 ArsR family transcriptional regulator [Natrinema salsiterrestre]
MARALAKEGFEDVYILDAESATEVLTPKRRELLSRLIEDDDVRSVRSLAEDVDRDKGAVSHDLELLAGHDLVTFERNGKRKVPKAKHQTVVVEPLL